MGSELVKASEAVRLNDLDLETISAGKDRDRSQNQTTVVQAGGGHGVARGGINVRNGSNLGRRR